MTQTAVNSAKVLYDLSTDKDDIKNAENILSLTPVFKEVLECPIVSLDKKEKVVDEIFKRAKLSSVVTNFVKEMCKVGNACELSDIFKAYYDYWDEKNHILRAVVTSAKKMSQDEIKVFVMIWKRSIRDILLKYLKRWMILYSADMWLRQRWKNMIRVSHGG